MKRPTKPTFRTYLLGIYYFSMIGLFVAGTIYLAENTLLGGGLLLTGAIAVFFWDRIRKKYNI